MTELHGTKTEKFYSSNIICDTHQSWSLPLSEVSAACDIEKPWNQKQTNPPTLIEELSIHLYDIAACDNEN